MKLNFGLLRQRWHLPLMLAAGFLPLPILICARSTPDMSWAGLPVAAIYLLLAELCIILPGKRRLIAGILGAAAICAAGVALLPWRGLLVMFLIPIAYAALLLASLMAEGGIPSITFSCLGLFCHVVAQFMQLVDAQVGRSMGTAVIAVLRIAFLLYGFLVLFALNRSSLNEAAAKGSPAPATVRRWNKMFTVAVGLITLIIACLPAILRFFAKIWDMIILGIMYLWRLLLALIRDDNAAEMMAGGGMGGGLPGTAGETALIWKILEKIFMALAIAVFVFLAWLVLKALWKKLKKLWAVAMERMRAFAQAASEDYHDEISDTREGGERTSLLKRLTRKRDPLKGIDEKKLTPRERVRFYYLKSRLKHPDWQIDQTARETLNADTAETYEKARYSQHDLSEVEAETFGKKLADQ